MEIKIGDKFFMFDENRRVYERDENGRAHGGPTFRGHFRPVTIVSETARSWITNYNQNIPKKEPFNVLYTEEMIDAAEWVSIHRYKIQNMVSYVRDAEILKKIAEIIGYEG